ncbi:MAG: acetylxylan esterase [Planctomycetota bacterium]|nr:MAG: acetylxylan esterase [Planctomycetota bacterium]
MPGFFVTGNLYRPKKITGKVPGILCPHGHWPNGRFYDMGEQAVKQAIIIGAERFENGGRSPLQARCVQLARMGCIVFHYDMLGYADSRQLSFELVHRFAKQRPEANDPQQWGLFSPQAESRLQSVMGLQTYNSIRSLDFLLSLPEVDPQRIGVTGASGGGTQTMILSAIDDRVAVSVPCVMVSTAMQGGCTCENACLLRIDTGNVEFAALFAPKPLAMTAADDWTREMRTKGFPELKALYTLLGAPDNVALFDFTHFKHNYNHVSRAHMYLWMNRHLKLGLPEPILERDYNRLTARELTVWDEKHPPPPGGFDFERQLLQWWDADARKQLDELVPMNRRELNEYRRVVGGAIDIMVGRRLPDAKQIEFEDTLKEDRGDYFLIGGLLKNAAWRTANPVLFLHPKIWNGQVVLWLDQSGKQVLFAGDQPAPQARRLLKAGFAVAGIDLLYQGEFLPDGKPLARTRKVDNPREAAAYTFGYNHTVFASRVHDVLTMLSFCRHHEFEPEAIHVLAGPKTAEIAAAARAQSADTVRSLAVHTGGFRFANVADIFSPDFWPGGAKYHDIEGLFALGAPGDTWIAGERSLPVVEAIYKAAGARRRLVLARSADDSWLGDAIDWIIDRAEIAD